MHNNPATSFLRPLLVPILRVHLFLTEIAILILKPTMVQSKQFTEDLTLNLLDKVIDGISVYEMTFLGVVGVEVEVER